MIVVRRHSPTRTDRAGDPLDGLVNLFDLGIVLAVAFLLAALQSSGLTQAALKKKTTQAQQPTLQITKNQKVVPIKPGTQQVPVQSTDALGTVYRDKNGNLVLVTTK
jgi:hypothetical protein